MNGVEQNGFDITNNSTDLVQVIYLTLLFKLSNNLTRRSYKWISCLVY